MGAPNAKLVRQAVRDYVDLDDCGVDAKYMLRRYEQHYILLCEDYYSSQNVSEPDRE